MFAARGSTRLILIDAATTGAEPGTLYQVPGEELAEDHQPTYSLHDLRWDHALAAGRRMFGEQFPTDITVWLIEAQQTGLGTEITSPVQDAGQRVYERILEEVAQFALHRHDEAPPVTLELRRGNLHIPAQVYADFFESKEGAVLLPMDGRMALLPVLSTAGGVLIKQRNLKGDRAVEIVDFLRTQGLDESLQGPCEAAWDPQMGALAITFPTPS